MVNVVARVISHFHQNGGPFETPILVVRAMEKALVDFSAGKVTQPVPSVITVDPPGGFLGLMLALADGLGFHQHFSYRSGKKVVFQSSSLAATVRRRQKIDCGQRPSRP